MFKSIGYYILVTAILLTIYNWLSPSKSISSVYVLIGLPTLFFVFFEKLRKASKSKINFGVIYFIAMAFFMVAGNLTSEIILFMFPHFNVTGMDNTNLFWLAGMFFFALGFILTKQKHTRNKNLKVYIFSKKYIIILFGFCLIATFFSILKLGFIPILNSSSGNERFFGEIASTTIIIRLYKMGVISSILATIYFFKINKDFKILLIALFSFSFMTIFFVRIFPALIIFSVGLFIISIIKNKKNIYLTIGLSLPLLLYINTSMLDYRSNYERSSNNSGEVSQTQTSVVSFSDDYTILNNFIRDYNDEFYYGQTFLAVPAAFIPSQVFQIFGIIKLDILHNTSARIVAKYYNVDAEGLRIGLMGELFLNFGFYGAMFMYFLGLITKKLQYKIETTNYSDFRLGFYYLFFTIILYSIDSQIDVIGTLVSEFLIVFLITKKLTKNYILSIK